MPRRGGTYLYCSHRKKIKGGVQICLWRHKIHPQGYRKFRLHYRKFHGEL